MRVELYGVLAQIAGDNHLELEVNDRETVQGILDQLETRMPALSAHLPRVACAVGDELVTRVEAVEADATLVLLPPVSGG